MCEQIKTVLFWGGWGGGCCLSLLYSESSERVRTGIATDCEVNESFIPRLWLEITTRAGEGSGTESSKFTQLVARLSKHKRFIG